MGLFHPTARTRFRGIDKFPRSLPTLLEPESATKLGGQSHAPRANARVYSKIAAQALLFGNDFHGRDRRIIHDRGKRKLNLPMCRRLNMRKDLDNGRRHWTCPSLVKDIEMPQEHLPVAGNVENAVP